MLGRLRQLVLIGIALVVGYAFGSGPIAEWVDDVTAMLRMAWLSERVSRGPSGTLPLLLAGFLLGQGLFLFARQTLKRIEPMRARQIERLACWEQTLSLGTRFGLHRYLAQCAAWAMPDPTARVPTLALFKIHGLGKLNEKFGTVRATDFLRRLAVELRSAALPDSTSAFRRWMIHYFPSQIIPSATGTPVARYPARWSGATFALAFRELDPVIAVTIARDVSAWIRQELTGLGEGDHCSLSAVVVVGGPGMHDRDLTDAAANLLSRAQVNSTLVQIDATDMRAEAISQLNGVMVDRQPYSHPDLVACSDHRQDSFWERRADWFRSWGASLGCVASAFLILGITGGKPPPTTSFPWPDSLREVQVVDEHSSRIVPLERMTLAARSVSDWAIPESLLVQGTSKEPTFRVVQFRVNVRNTSNHTFFVGPADFTMVDISGRRLSFDELRSMRISQGLVGFWIRPGEARAGWLVGFRQDAPIVAVEFAPNRQTRVELVESRTRDGSR